MSILVLCRWMNERDDPCTFGTIQGALSRSIVVQHALPSERCKNDRRHGENPIGSPRSNPSPKFLRPHSHCRRVGVKCRIIAQKRIGAGKGFLLYPPSSLAPLGFLCGFGVFPALPLHSSECSPVNVALILRSHGTSKPSFLFLCVVLPLERAEI